MRYTVVLRSGGAFAVGLLVYRYRSVHKRGILCGMVGAVGKKTSVYLSDALAERVEVSGLSLAELVRRGLDAGEPPPLGRLVRDAVREGFADAPLWFREALAAVRDQEDNGIPASRPESPGEILAKVTRAREAAEQARQIAKERKPARKPSRPRAVSAAPSAGTAVFAAPGEEPVVTSPVPAAPAGRVHAPNCKCFVCKLPKGTS